LLIVLPYNELMWSIERIGAGF